MIRKAFVMSVNSGSEVEYENRHRPIWPELEEVLKKHGVHNYSIFLHPETRQLFGYAEIESEARWNAIAQTPVCKKWCAQPMTYTAKLHFLIQQFQARKCRINQWIRR